MALQRGSVRLALCALLIGAASAQALTPHDKAIGVHAAQLGNDQSDKEQSAQSHTDPAQKDSGATTSRNEANAAREREEDRHDKLRSDAIAGIIGFVTFSVLIVQTIFFRRQAKSLENTIVTMRHLGRRQSKEMKESLKVSLDVAKITTDNVELTRKTLILAQRPKIRVGNIWAGNSMWERPAFYKLNTIVVQFDYENVGGMPAFVRDADAMIISNEHGLPYSYPIGTRRNPGIERKNKQPLIEPKTLAPGEMDSGVFSGRDHHQFHGEQAEALSSGKTGFFLFVIGWIEYTDELQIVRRTRFARQYNHATGRFLPVSDPDYEYEA